jgi:hypothetical protein
MMASNRRNQLRSLLRLERLEDRKCFNVDIGLADGGHTLLIRGDRDDNQVDIAQDASGVHVTADQGRTLNFQEIHKILLTTEGGNDVVNLKLSNDLNFRPLEIVARLGAGDDTFNAEVGNGAARITLDMGAGNDTLKLRSTNDFDFLDGNFNFHKLDFAIDLGAGDDTFDGIIGGNVAGLKLNAGAGNDALKLRSTADFHFLDGNFNFHKLDFLANLGAGDDTFDAEFSGNIDRLNVNAGAGDDAVTINTGLDAVGINFTCDLGAGDDTFTSDIVSHKLGEHNPPADRIAVMGGAGNDAFHSLIRSDDSALLPAVLVESIDLRFEGGAGNDTFESLMRNVVFQGSVRVEAQGQAGNDAVMAMFDRVTVKAGLDMLLGGGEGEDLLSLLALSPTRSEGAFAPSLLSSSRTRIFLEGGDGNDRIVSEIVPCVLPQGTIDLNFTGGRGNDSFDVTLTMEPTAKAPSFDGSVRMTILGGEGNDALKLKVNNLRESGQGLKLRLEGGAGDDTAVVSPGIDPSGWTGSF